MLAGWDGAAGVFLVWARITVARLTGETATVASVVVSWAVVHTAFTLRSAQLYYSDPTHAPSGPLRPSARATRGRD